MSDFRPDIWRLQAQLDTEGLIEALVNTDAGIRKRAATALRALGAVGSIPILKQLLETESDTDARAHFVSALESLQEEAEKQKAETKKVVDTGALREGKLQQLILQLNSEDEAMIIQSAKNLAELKDKQAVEPLIVLFKDPTVSIKVRLAVAEALLQLESAPVEVALLGALRSNQWRVRRNGAAILGQLRADWAVEPLSKALEDEHELVRRTSYAALRYIATKEAQKAVKRAMEKAKKRRTARLTLNTAKLNKLKSPPPSTPTSGLLKHVKSADEKTNSQLDDNAVKETTEKTNDDQKDEEVATTTDSASIAWPRRNVEATSLAPTQQLNPEVLDEAKARYERMKKDKKQDES